MIWKKFFFSCHINLNIPEGKRVERAGQIERVVCVCVCVCVHLCIERESGRERGRERMGNTNEYLNELS